MKAFFDTSSLFKLYHKEIDSEYVEDIFTSFTISEIFLSDITKIEFASAIWKKVRTQQITEKQANILSESFETDYNKYTFIQADNSIIEHARLLLIKHGKMGLRTLDSIQLSTAVLLKNNADLYISSDTLLDFFLKQEGLQTDKTKL